MSLISLIGGAALAGDMTANAGYPELPDSPSGDQRGERIVWRGSDAAHRRSKYFLLKSHTGKPNEGLLVETTGGLVEADLRYLPPKTPVEFVAYSENAPTGGRTRRFASGCDMMGPFAPSGAVQWRNGQTR